MIRIFHKRLIVFLVFTAAGMMLAACNDRPEPRRPLKQVVISGVVEPREADTNAVSDTEKDGAEKNDAQKKEGTPVTLPPSPVVAPAAIAVPVDTIKAVPATEAAPGAPPSVEPDDEILGKNLELEPEKFDEPMYSAEGKIDPFTPLVKDRTKETKESQVVDKKPKRFLTPLEKLDLSQVKLVAVVMTETGNIAMVEEASGKGYMVDIGTAMGRNGGKVAFIESDRITVVERVKDYKGTTVSRSHELILHKSENED